MTIAVESKRFLVLRSVKAFKLTDLLESARINTKMELITNIQKIIAAVNELTKIPYFLDRKRAPPCSM